MKNVIIALFLTVVIVGVVTGVVTALAIPVGITLVALVLLMCYLGHRFDPIRKSS